MDAFAVRYIPSATEHCRPQGLAGLALAFHSSAHRPLPKAPKLHHAPAEWSTNLHIEGRLVVLLDTASALGSTGLGAVAELAGDGLEVLHAAGTSGLSPLGLLAPVVLPDTGARVTAVGASVLLDVERATTAASAQNVRLVVALSEAGRSLRHFVGIWGGSLVGAVDIVVARSPC